MKTGKLLSATRRICVTYLIEIESFSNKLKYKCEEKNIFSFSLLKIMPLNKLLAHLGHISLTSNLPILRWSYLARTYHLEF